MKIQEVMLAESIHDRYLFKALFFAGPPAAGKSTLIQGIYDGSFGIKVVDPDSIAAVMAKARGVTHQDVYNTPALKQDFTQKKISQLTQFVNGMLPMFIDATAGDFSRTVDRSERLETFGYDVGMVWLGTDLAKIFDNMSHRERQVDAAFVTQTFQSLYDNYIAYRKFFGASFYVHENKFLTPTEQQQYGELLGKIQAHKRLTDIEGAQFLYLQDRYKEAADTVVSRDVLEKNVRAFIEEPLKNRRGTDNLAYLNAHGGNQLTDGIYTLGSIQRILSGW